MNLPASFTVGATIKYIVGGGRLTIDRGTIVLEPGPLLARASNASRITQTKSDVTLVTARVAPPWMNTGLVVAGDGNVGSATTWFGARRRLRAALEEAGFRIHETRTWFSTGELWRYSR